MTKAILLSESGISTTGDQSANVAQWIYTNRGNLLVIDPPPGQMYMFGGILLSDSSYDGTEIWWRGFSQLPSNIGTSPTFGGCYIGVVIGSCELVTLREVKYDGNRANMTQNEHIVPIGIAGAIRPRITDGWNIREIRGDAIYIGQADWTAQSDNPQYFDIGNGMAWNSADDGRNAISVISCTTGKIGNVTSVGIGGVINGVTQPGGVDIEPDYGYQSVTDLKIGDLRIVTAGTAGVGVIGKSISGNNANRDWNCFGIEFGNIRITRTGVADPSLPDPNDSPALSASPFVCCADVDILRGRIEYATGTRGQGIAHDMCQDIRANWKVSNVTVGVAIGMGDSVFDSEFVVKGSNYTTAIVRSSSTVRVDINVKATGSVSGSTAFPVQAHSGGRSNVSQVNTHYRIDAPYDGNNARAFRNEPGATVSFGVGTEIRGGDWTGYSGPTTTIDAVIPKRSVKGLMEGAQYPQVGYWAKGDIFKIAPPQYNPATGKVLGEVLRLTDGNGSTFGTDWINNYGTAS